ncbi:MAG: hypothetical protein HC817_15120 [Saprospiraceae bacterium]|nr:hypothetical protein [Saprospiraceae bacterium]
MKKLYTASFVLLFAIFSCKNANPKNNSFNYSPQEPKTARSDAEILHDLQKLLTDIIVKDIFTPPVASRVYVYPLLSAYEAGRFCRFKCFFNG